jgi:hypothetical protein
MNIDHEVTANPSVGDVQELIGRLARINTGEGDKSDDLERGKAILDGEVSEYERLLSERTRIRTELDRVDTAISEALAGCGADQAVLRAVGY